jgi:hypothetical protein
MSFLETMRHILKTEGLVTVTRPDWLGAWRKLAKLTAGITEEDSRFRPVMESLAQCDTAYLAGDWDQFQKAAEQVRISARLEPEM